MKISIIIPVYNTESTLDRCLESVLRQTMSDDEVLLIDDGSTDCSPQLCEEWARRDPRVRTIHQSNGGLSQARNTGLAHAQGELIAFVDSDDTLECHTLEEVRLAFCRHPGYNIVEFPVFVSYGDTTQHLLTFPEQGHTDIAAYWTEHRGYLHAYTWNKVYRRKLFQHIRFPKGKIFEDTITTARLLKASGNIFTIDRGLYFYWKNPHGITATAGPNELRQLLCWHLLIRRQYIPQQGTSRRSRTLYYLHLVNIQMDVFRLGPSEILLPVEPLPLCALFYRGLSLTTRCKAAVIKMLSLTWLCRINKALYRYKRQTA